MVDHASSSGTLRKPYRDLDSVELLRARPSVMLDVSPGAEQALSELGIDTLFDLGSSWLFGNARAIAALSTAGSPESRIGLLSSGLLDEDVVLESPADASALGIEHLQGLDADRAHDLKAALGVETIDDLAFWPPQAFARQLNAEASGDMAPSAEPGDELRPRLGDYPTERVYYDTLVMLEMEGDQAAAARDLSSDGPVPLTPVINSVGFARPAVGARITMAQSWFAQGVTLGHLLHCLALAPGEATRVAVIDWTRRTKAFSSESIGESERLDDSSTHSRSLSEVQDAVARESQQGFSDSSATASSQSSSEQTATGSGFFSSLMSSNDQSRVDNQATTSSEAQSRSWSAGERQLSAKLTQRVQDRTEQHAISVRNRRASAVREVSQTEHEDVSTRVVCNYNHMHALTVQYFEVVQMYRVDIEVHDIDRIMFVPLELLDFSDEEVVDRFRAALMRNALTRRALDLLLDSSATVTVTASAPIAPPPTGPTGPVGPRTIHPEYLSVQASVGGQSAAAGKVPPANPENGGGGGEASSPAESAGTTPSTSGATSTVRESHPMFIWDARAMDRASRLTGIPVLRPGSMDLHVPADTILKAISFTGFSVTKLRLSRQGDSTELDVPRGTWVALPDDTLLADVLEVDIAKSSAAAVDATMTLECGAGGIPFSLPSIPVSLGPGTDFQVVLSLSSDVQARRAELREHLTQNRLYYSQSAYRSLDSAAITSILAPYEYRGTPLIEQVDPTPITVAANFLVLRAPTDMSDEQGLTEWGSLLKDRGVNIGPGEGRLVSLPTGGVFAEAVLGRANSAEMLDLTRFWNWQDSPIPIQPPEIAPVSTESRGTQETLTPGQLGAPVLNITNPTALPEPSGLAAILGALASGNMFRDMSGLAGTQGLVSTAMQGTQQAATDAGQLASTNMRTEAQKAVAMGQIAADLAKAAMGVPPTGGSQGISADGAKINHGRSLDDRGVGRATQNAKGSVPSGRSGSAPTTDAGGSPVGAAASANTTNQSAGDGASSYASGGPMGGSYEADATDHAVWGAPGGSGQSLFNSAEAAGESNGGSNGLQTTDVSSISLPDLSQWRELTLFKAPPAVVQALAGRGSPIPWSVLPIEGGYGDINLDYYPVSVSRLPRVGGAVLTPDQFLSYIRLHINDFVDTTNSEFFPYDDSIDRPKWVGANPLGSVIHIDMRTKTLSANLADGSVVVSEAGSDHWVFSTLWTGQDGYHPVSGNRRFGFDAQTDGTFVFYTRGADRVSTSYDWALSLGGKVIFSNADALWRSLQRKIADFVNDPSQGGSAFALNSYSVRFDWDGVRNQFSQAASTSIPA